MSSISIPNLPPAIALSGQEQFEIVQSGVSRRTTIGAIYGTPSYTAPLRGLLFNSGSLLSPVTEYGVRTGVGPLTLVVPPLSSVQGGDWIKLYDVDFNAAGNNVLLQTSSADLIQIYGSTVSSQVLNVSGFSVVLMATPLYWSLVVL